MKKSKNKYQVSFFPTILVEDYLSEKILWVEADTEQEAKNKATQAIEKEDKAVNYRREDPIIVKFG